MSRHISNSSSTAAPSPSRLDGSAPLLSVLRDDLGLRGTKFGCGTEQCGACMVLIDGKPEYSCTREVATRRRQEPSPPSKGCRQRRAASPLQQAFLDEQAGQCGYCLSGILISAAALLDENTKPSRADIIAALDPHLCRCGIHNRVIRAVQKAGAIASTAGARP